MRLVTAILLAALVVACSPSEERVTATSNAPDEQFVAQVRADSDISDWLREAPAEDILDLGRHACEAMDTVDTVDEHLNLLYEAADGDEAAFMDGGIIAFYAAETICPRNWPMFEDAYSSDT